ARSQAPSVVASPRLRSRAADREKAWLTPRGRCGSRRDIHVRSAREKRDVRATMQGARGRLLRLSNRSADQPGDLMRANERAGELLRLAREADARATDLKRQATVYVLQAHSCGA